MKANAVQWSSFHTPLHSGVDGMLQVLPRMVLNVTLEDIWYLIAVFYMCSFYCSVLPVHDSFLEKKNMKLVSVAARSKWIRVGILI